MSNETMPAEIAKRLVAAQRAARGVEKTSANTFHKYRYASAEAIIEEARDALGGAGLAVACVGWSVVRAERDESGRAVAFDRVEVAYIIASETGETWTMQPVSTPIIPEKGRPEDKAEATALTYSLGYTLRGLLLLPRVEEGANVDARDDSKHVPRHERVEPAAPAVDPDVLADIKSQMEAAAERGDLAEVDRIATVRLRPLQLTGDAKSRMVRVYKAAREHAVTILTPAPDEAESEAGCGSDD